MKSFYVISLALVVLLSLSPFVLLKESELKGTVISYNTYGAKIRSLDPATCGDTMSAALQGNIYDSLYAYDYLARPVKVVPQLAEGMPEVYPDGKTYTIRIRQGIKYRRDVCFGVDADGNPGTRTVRAEDFVLAFKRIADHHIATPMSLAFVEDKIVGIKEYREKTRTYDKGDFSRYDKENIKGVRAVDGNTLRIELRDLFPQLLYVLAIDCYAPIPRELVEYHLTSRDGRSIRMKDRSPVIADCRAAVGTGPYYLEKYVYGGDLILRRNPDFRDECYPSPPKPEELARMSEEERKNVEEDKKAGLYDDAGKKVPFVDVQVWTFVAEDNPMWEMFHTKQVDVSGIPRQVYYQVITPGKELTDEWAKKGIRLIKYGNPAIYWIVFNMEDKVVGKSKALRQAMFLAFDIETYIDVLHNGRAIRAVNVLPSSFEAYKEAGPSPYARYDVQAAKRKLAEARKELEAAGALKAGEPLALTLDLGDRDEEARRMGEFVQKQFKQIGVELKVELNDWPTLQEKVENKQVQMYTMGWHADYPDPENFLQLYYSPNIKRGTNNANYNNPKFDELYERAAKMKPGDPERTKVYVEMVRILNEECPVLLLTEPISFVLVHPWVHNVKQHPIGYGFYKYRRIDPAERRKAGGRE